jgi:phage-related protein
MIAAGEAEVYWEAPDGERRLLTRLPAGSVFGEMGLMTGAPRSATVVAAQDVECYRLDKASFADVLHARPALAEAMARVLAERQHHNEALRDAFSKARGGAAPTAPAWRDPAARARVLPAGLSAPVPVRGAAGQRWSRPRLALRLAQPATQFSARSVLPVKDAHGIDTFVERHTGARSVRCRLCHPPHAIRRTARVHAQVEYIAYARAGVDTGARQVQQVLPRYIGRRGTHRAPDAHQRLVHAAVPHGISNVMSFAHFRSVRPVAGPGSNACTAGTSARRQCRTALMARPAGSVHRTCGLAVLVRWRSEQQGACQLAVQDLRACATAVGVLAAAVQHHHQGQAFAGADAGRGRLRSAGRMLRRAALSTEASPVCRSAGVRRPAARRHNTHSCGLRARAGRPPACVRGRSG